MYKILKHEWGGRDKIFFSTDWHVFHDPKAWDEPIWKMRGYSSLDEETEDIIYKVNSKVGEDDTLYYMGDIFLNATDEMCCDFLNRINCQNINLLFGNHESNMYRIYKQNLEEEYGFREVGNTQVEVYPLRVGNVVFMGNHLEIRVGKQHIVMNHFPLHIWNKNNWKHGSPAWNLSGHSHNSDPTRNPDCPTGKHMDCGWDWKKDIWTFEEISDIMSTKTSEILDHHDAHTT